MVMRRRNAVGYIQGQLISPELLNPPAKRGRVDVALTRYIVELPALAIQRFPDDLGLESL